MKGKQPKTAPNAPRIIKASRKMPEHIRYDMGREEEDKYKLIALSLFHQRQYAVRQEAMVFFNSIMWDKVNRDFHLSIKEYWAPKDTKSVMETWVCEIQIREI